MRKNKISLEFYKELHKEHIEDRLHVKDLCEKYSINYTTLYYGFVRNGLEIDKSITRDTRRTKVNDDYFSIIDDEVKAYYLGLLMADGHIEELRNIVSLKLHKDDKYLVEGLRDLLSPDKKVIKDGDSFKFNVVSEKMVSDLQKLGLHFHKTEVGETFPDIKPELKPHFIRGFFDGDGSISVPRKDRPKQVQVYICSVNQKFLDDLQNYLASQDIEVILNIEIRSDKLTKHGNSQRDMLKLRFGTHESRIKFYNMIYPKNVIMKMNRKYERYLEYVNTVLTTKYKKFVAV